MARTPIQRVTPTHVAELVSFFDQNVTRAAAEIGCHSSTLQKALNSNEVTVTIENRAMRALQHLHKQLPQSEVVEEVPTDKPESPDEQVTAVIVFPAAIKAKFEKVVSLFGAEMVEF